MSQSFHLTGTSCVDRNNQKGECISFRFCYSLQGATRRQNWQNYIVQCGWEGFIPKVCCTDQRAAAAPNFNFAPGFGNNNFGANNFGANNFGANNLPTSSFAPNVPVRNPGVGSIVPFVFPSSDEVTMRPVSRPNPAPVPTQTNLLPGIGECGLGPTDRIVGGTATALDEFPWMALLKYSKGKRQ